jgi:plastocyanin
MTRLLFRTVLALILSACAFAAVAAGAVSATDAAAGSNVTDVKIDNFSFAPQTITIPVGTQVRWTNHDDIPHNTVSEEQAFKSTVLDTDQQFTHAFTKPGTYKYFCSIHPRMTGTVVVQ